MENENITYLNNYISKQIFLSDCNCSKYELTKQLNICENCILTSRSGDNINKGDYVFVDFCPNKIYIVKPKDTIASIARKLNITEESIIKKNDIKAIFIGQQIII